MDGVDHIKQSVSGEFSQKNIYLTLSCLTDKQLTATIYGVDPTHLLPKQANTNHKPDLQTFFDAGL